jgi:hypothetical protein
VAEVFAVELESQHPLVVGEERLQLAGVAACNELEALGHYSHEVLVVLAEEELRDAGYRIEEGILLDDVRIKDDSFNSSRPLLPLDGGPEALGDQLMPVADADQSEIDVGLISSEYVVDGGLNVVGQVKDRVRTPRDDDAGEGHQLLDGGEFVVPNFEDGPVFVVVEVTEEERWGIDAGLERVGGRRSISHNPYFLVHFPDLR